MGMDKAIFSSPDILFRVQMGVKRFTAPEFVYHLGKTRAHFVACCMVEGQGQWLISGRRIPMAVGC